MIHCNTLQNWMKKKQISVIFRKNLIIRFLLELSLFYDRMIRIQIEVHLFLINNESFSIALEGVEDDGRILGSSRTVL